MINAMYNIFTTVLEIPAEYQIDRVHIPMMPDASYAQHWQCDAASLMLYGIIGAYKRMGNNKQARLTRMRIDICCSSQHEADWFNQNTVYWCGVRSNNASAEPVVILAQPAGTPRRPTAVSAEEVVKSGSQSTSPASQQQQGGLSSTQDMEVTASDKAVGIEALREARPIKWQQIRDDHDLGRESHLLHQERPHE